MRIARVLGLAPQFHLRAKNGGIPRPQFKKLCLFVSGPRYSSYGTSRLHPMWAARRSFAEAPCCVVPPYPLSVKRSRRQKMKRVTLLCGLLLALTATVASAAGLGLRWTECIGDGGAPNRAFACNANTGSSVLVGTFQLGAAGLAQTSGEEIVIDIGSASATLPAWWQFKNVGTCRTGSLLMGSAPTGNAANCADWGGGLATAGVGAYTMGQ